MKFFLFALILYIICCNTNLVFAEEKIGDTHVSQEFIIPKEYITQAKLLESYIIRYAQNINQRANDFQVGSHTFLNETYILLRDMKLSLTKIQNKEFSASKSRDILTNIVQRLKQKNQEVQSFFTKQETLQKRKIFQKKVGYNAFSLKLSGAINRFINKLTQALLQKKSLTQAEKDLAQILPHLKQENKMLGNFVNKRFVSEQDMKHYLQIRIKNIRAYISDIKSLAR